MVENLLEKLLWERMILHFLKEVTKYVDKNSAVDIIHMDLNMTFGKVPTENWFRRSKPSGSKANWQIESELALMTRGRDGGSCS